MKLFYHSYHQIHKEPQYKTQHYQTTFEFMTKILNNSKKEDLKWKTLESFEVGRPKLQGNLPVKRFVALCAAIAYLVFGLLVYVFSKMFSSRPKGYKFATVVFKWPKAIFAVFRALRLGNNKSLPVFR